MGENNLNVFFVISNSLKMALTKTMTPETGVRNDRSLFTTLG